MSDKPNIKNENIVKLKIIIKMKKLVLINFLFISLIPMYSQQWNGSSDSEGAIYRNGNIGIGVSPNQKLHIQGGHYDSRILLHSTGGGMDTKYADLMLWASEPGLTYSGVGIGNNVINVSTAPYLQRINSQRGGSYIRLLEGKILMNVIKNDGSNINVVNINDLGYFGIGVNNPRAFFDVNTFINNGKLGAVFGRLSEGDDSGDGTFLGVKGYETQIATYNGKSFAIEHSFYGQINSSINFYRGGSTTGGFISFNINNNTEAVRIKNSGNVLIGKTTQQNSNYKLDVAGSIRADEIKVNLDGADFVFDSDYKLRTLNEVELYIKENKRLPEFASADEMSKDGADLGELNTKLLQKIEELTLYLIEQNKKIEELQNQISEIKN